MAKHKAPTAVTIAPLAEASPFERFLQRYWVPAILLILAVVAGVVVRHILRERARGVRDGSWEQLLGATQPGGILGLPSAAPDRLQGLAAELQGTEAGPWARLLQVQALVEERRYGEALTALDALEQGAPRHPLVAEVHDLGEGTPRSFVGAMREDIVAQQEWEAGRPELFALPDPPEDAPRVRIRTDQGDLVVALYTQQAPRHAENFLELAQQGYYDGTRFHRISSSFIQGGDPNSKDLDHPETWGQGGPETQLEPEPSGLAHFPGALSMAKKEGEALESGSQFFITTAPVHHLDGLHTVFGKVLEGLDVARAIGSAPVAAGAPERPAEPVIILGVEPL